MAFNHAGVRVWPPEGGSHTLLGLRERDPKVKAIAFARNFGQMAAMLAGFREATGDAVINISADLQDPMDLVPQMVEKWRRGDEIVICYRAQRGDQLTAKLFSRVAYGILRLSLPQIPPGGFDFVLMDRKVMDEFNAIDVRHRFFQGDLLWTGYRASSIPYARLKRSVGRSQYNFGKKLMKRAIPLTPLHPTSCGWLIKAIYGAGSVAKAC